MADLLYLDVALGLNVGLTCRIRVTDRHNRGQVLKVERVFHFDLAKSLLSMAHFDYARKGRAHHFLVVRVVGLVDERKLVSSVLLLDLNKLSKLKKKDKEENKSGACMQIKQKLDLNATYHPRFVHKIINHIQRVGAWYSAVLQTDDDISPIRLARSSMLTHKNKVGFE